MQTHTHTQKQTDIHTPKKREKKEREKRRNLNLDNCINDKFCKLLSQIANIKRSFILDKNRAKKIITTITFP